MLQSIFTKAASTNDYRPAFLVLLKILFTYLVLLNFQAQSCHAQNDDVFLPAPKVKTLEPRATTSTPLPVTEKNLWGIRLWQVMGLALVGTIVLITFCCCLCDCRIPQTSYDKEDKPQVDSDCSDTEPAAAVYRTPQVPQVSQAREPQGGKKLANGSAPRKSQMGSIDHEIGRTNTAFDNGGEISAPHSENWKGTPRVTFCRQP